MGFWPHEICSQRMIRGFGNVEFKPYLLTIFDVICKIFSASWRKIIRTPPHGSHLFVSDTICNGEVAQFPDACHRCGFIGRWHPEHPGQAVRKGRVELHPCFPIFDTINPKYIVRAGVRVWRAPNTGYTVFCRAGSVIYIGNLSSGFRLGRTTETDTQKQEIEQLFSHRR